MTFKYLHIIGEMGITEYFRFLHIPLDNYVFDVVEKEFDEKRPLLSTRKSDGNVR